MKQLRAIMAGIERDTETGARDYAVLVVMARRAADNRGYQANLKTCGPGGETVLYIQGQKGQRPEKRPYQDPGHAERQSGHTWRSGKASAANRFLHQHNRNQGRRMTTRSISRIVKDR